MRLNNVLESQQFKRQILESLFEIAREMENLSDENKQCLTGKIMTTLFYEPSTRTRLSFESAMLRLGGRILTTENASDFSSAAKGETLEDTIRVIGEYSDIIVLRHYESGASKRAARVNIVPIVNAGDGPGQHPTQALLDLYTIDKELHQIDGINIAMVGDLAFGRTVRSLSYLLAKFKDIHIYFVSHPEIKMKQDIKDYLDRHNVSWEEESDLVKVAKEVDVIYQTRLQKERFGDKVDEYESAKGMYKIDNEVLSYMKKKSIVMHPLPRVDEIELEVDKDPRAAYFRQAKNGKFIRMALIKSILLGIDL